jgi:menaquinone-dependent protoporphyrinogen oxidase
MPTKSISRRDCLKIAGITLAATAVTCSGLGFAATRKPDIPTPDLVFGDETILRDRILVAYATRAGSTVEIAAAIGESLSQRNNVVDVKPVTEKPDTKPYQAVIIGSAIRMGNWLPEAVDYIKQNQQILNQIPVALFTVHMLNTGDDETSLANRLAYLDSVRELLTAHEEAFFAGKMDFSKLSFLDRMISRVVGAVEDDQRDWTKIHSWGQTVFT